MRRSLTLAALCSLAFALSYAYVQVYLRGGPRIIDATSYFLEARSLAAGSFAFPVPDPSAAFRGRFLLPSADGHTLGVIFPAGYPLLLSLGVRLGAPLLVGPTLAALLVAASYALARALGQTSKVALLAAALSALCAALRYHTADTMSHGLATLLGVTALALALARRQRLAPLLSGLCLGLLFATRPVSAAVSGVLVAVSLSRAPRAWLLLVVGMLPGALLLCAQQRALTGSWLGSTQLAYYAASDAPTGCFRYGFGAGIGCRYEHGEYVSRFIPDGFGLGHALRNLLVRLGLFATDATNAAPLTLLGGYALLRQRSSLWRCGAAIALQALAYLPFYFDGNYPGGGVRFLCEAIPFAHILVARAACDLRVPWLAPLAALAGFALYARHGHEQLRDREGGRPMFEPKLVAAAGVKQGLLFVDTDHGFNLGHDPAQDAGTGLIVARLRGDAHDRDLYEQLGRPEAYRYIYDFKGGPAQVVRYVPLASTRFESEAEWPALPSEGSAYPIHHPCASRARALRLLPATRVALPIRWPGPPPEQVTLGWAAKTAQGARLRVSWSGSGAAELVSFPGGCRSLSLAGPGPKGRSPLLVELVSGEGAVDFLDVGAPPPP
jgi:hypothetical protein